MAEKIIVIDEGTTSTRTMLFAADGTPLGSAQREFRQYYPGPVLPMWVSALLISPSCSRSFSSTRPT